MEFKASGVIKKGTHSGDNKIVSENDLIVRSITFRGKGNSLVVDPLADLSGLHIDFDCNNATIKIGRSAFAGRLRVGEDSSIYIGDWFTATSPIFISTAEGASIVIGDDVMAASSVIIRGEDSHAIYDVETGLRVNKCQDVEVGDHVWIGERCSILSGARIGSGSILGLGSILTCRIPNNCIAVGVPARVVRENVAWEREHLTYHEPYYKRDKSDVKITQKYWNSTQQLDALKQAQPFYARLVYKVKSFFNRFPSC